MHEPCERVWQIEESGLRAEDKLSRHYEGTHQVEPGGSFVRAYNRENRPAIREAKQGDVYNLEEVESVVEGQLDAQEEVVDEAGPCYPHNHCLLTLQEESLDAGVFDFEALGDVHGKLSS